LRFETADSGRPLPWKIDPLGPAVTFRFDRDSGRPAGNAQESAEQSDVAIVDSSRVHRLELGVGPEEVGRIPVGTYTIRAVLPLDQDPNGDSRLVSNTVTLTVEGGEAIAHQPAAAEKTRLEAAARFYLRSEKWEEAHRFALELAERRDADTVAFMLLGDALNGLRRDEEALAAYHQALATLPETQDESPDYLIARLEEVQDRLASSRGSGRP
jgi:tetratricopeptide (TPR) repeat protein